MSGEELGFAIIGSGMIARLHAQEIANLEGARLVAIAGRSPNSAASLAKEYGAACYTDYREMLMRNDISVVTICTPSGMHGEMAIAAAKAGKHVLVEKPMDISLETADRMIAEARRYDVKLAVISQNRFNLATLELKNIIESGEMGDIVLAEAAVNWYRTQEYYDSANWRGTWALDGGGAAMNQSIHTIDLLLHLLGPAKSVIAHMQTAAHERIEVEDVLTALVRFKNGALCTIACTTAAYPGFANRIELFGTKGSAALESDTITNYFLKDRGGVNLARKPPDGALWPPTTGASNPTISGAAHLAQFRDMAAAIREKREPLVNGLEGRATLELVLAMYRSAQEDRLIEI
jgi:UDP-N-acetyl-2-amino-2-deoxyglucuronate dehydrogenase